jgi:hypothetical protein
LILKNIICKKKKMSIKKLKILMLLEAKKENLTLIKFKMIFPVGLLLRKLKMINSRIKYNQRSKNKKGLLIRINSFVKKAWIRIDLK